MRSIAALTMFALAALAAAQAPFTIVRPVEGSHVREKVKVLFPKSSVPPGGYVGVYIDGKMIEAVKPDVTGKYCSYILDTKGMGLKDGKTKLGIVLFVDYNDQPRIEGKSSVDVVIGNHANIKVPAGGLKLRYAFNPGTETVYNYYHRLGVANLTAAQARQEKPAPLPIEAQHLRMVYAVDNRYSNGDGLVRLQALPPKGQNQVFLQTVVNPTGRKYADAEFGQMYQRLTSTGNEVFGTAPEAFPSDGFLAGPDQTSLYVLEPLPTLPPQPVRPGDVWQTRFQEDAIDLANVHSQNSLVRPIPARGEFVDVEWEMDHPCALIHQTVASTVAGTKNRIAIDENVWFALDKRVIIKIVRTMSLDRPAGAAGPAAPAGRGATGGQPANTGGQRRGNTPAAGGRPNLRDLKRGGLPFRGRADDPNATPVDIKQGSIMRRLQNRQPMRSTKLNLQMRSRQVTATNQRSSQNTGTTPAAAATQRITVEDTFILES